MPGIDTEPLWYKDAVFYELHVKAFKDSNSDGMGDFDGLMGQLDYIRDLGVDVIWLLPCYPSPLRDDGYDIADYYGIHSDYGTLDAFDRFIEAAHERGMRVITDLVLNHTSDQHPWFQRARRSPEGSPERDFYVWSDTDDRYSDTRIIFIDTEPSNWTWDPVAGQYYWHRFFSHQPDLNWDNPAVYDAMVEVLDFWLERGLDGFRADAVPYLIEREGTNCENLPETHDILKRIRKHMDERWPGRIILAEANQWPDDVRPYFGDGDECHMAFHFPLMPRIFMAVRQGMRKPIVEIIERTPAIPENTQWCMFLRNHDELTLEMVTDEERDYMYNQYAADPRMRLNLGIRRRLAPLLDNDRRKIELLNSILFTMPGSPIIYYGDELGMGDNIYLGDRDGVRTPMQWSLDRNAGFSRAEPSRLYLPVIADTVYGYQAINVEAQQKSPFSLLNWMKRLIQVRKRHRAFGRGSLRFLRPENPHVLAYVREYEDDTILVVHNLSGAAQSVQLDLSEYDGRIPVELLGETQFLPIDEKPYALTLSPYGFFWFDIRSRERVRPSVVPDVLATAEATAEVVEEIPREWLRERRWFRDKARPLARVHLRDRIPIAQGEAGTRILALIQTDFEEGLPSWYLLPLAAGQEDGSPTLVPITTERGAARVTDATADEVLARRLLHVMEEEHELDTDHGRVRGFRTAAFHRDAGDGRVRAVTVEQSNSAVIVDEELFLKLYRQIETGINPDVELGRFLTEEVGFDQIPPLHGWIEYEGEDEEPATIVALTGFVPNEGDGWSFVMEQLKRTLDRAVGALDEDGDRAGDRSAVRVAYADLLDTIEALGRTTANLHRALASAGEEHPDIEPHVADESHRDRWVEALTREADTVLEEVSARLDSIPGSFTVEAQKALAKVVHGRGAIRDQLAELEDHVDESLLAIRTHGDYHLGQVLYRGSNDWLVLDFEGEVGRPLGERRFRQLGLRDVAGMLRSFTYAAEVVLRESGSDDPRTERALRGWEAEARQRYIDAYRGGIEGQRIAPTEVADFMAILGIFEMEKAIYELDYELNNRPEWIWIPVRGIRALMGEAW